MFALIGHPLGHSMSPFIHKRLFDISGKNEDYELCDIDPEKLKEEFPAVMEKYEGLNVTIPYKTDVIEFLDRLDSSAERYGAVNCILKDGGKLVGYNTDCIGFIRSVPEQALGGRFLLSGCGGAGRMMALEAAAHGGDITMAIKDFSAQQAEVLTEEINTKFPEVSVKTVPLDNVKGSFDLYANATPVGMYPNV
ncbi:MAG: shikimate dehydrogenase family protein, partial [Porcipelethomonas sp.]